MRIQPITIQPNYNRSLSGNKNNVSFGQNIKPIEPEGAPYRLTGGLKTPLSLKPRDAFDRTLLNTLRLDLQNNKHVSLYLKGFYYLDAYINHSSYPNLFLHITSNDLSDMRRVHSTLECIRGGDGEFELSILGTNKKAQIHVPHNKLTKEMRRPSEIENMFYGPHPFLIDMTKYLDKHPEIFEEINKSVKDIDLPKVASEFLKWIRTCK